MEHAWTDTYDVVADAALAEASRIRRPRRGALVDRPASERTLLCARCWHTFDGFSRASCPKCTSPRPDGGWSSLPYTFRDRYVFTRLIGRGGMGAVFFAFDEHQLDEDRRAVAVKVVPTSGAPALRDALKRMFEREAAAAAMLAQSPHFVRVTSHDVGVEPAYMVMEYVDWPTLRGLLRRGQGEAQPLTPIKAVRIGAAMLRGLSTMHFHRIVHRDLKPDNIFVRRSASGEDYDVKILDLGVWTYDATQRTHLNSLSAMPRQDEGSPIGTFAYMSPEQMTLAPVGPASDIHTVGSVLWELITGTVPYPMPRRELAPAMRERHDRMRAPPPKPACMPEGLYNILARALAFDGPERWPSADEMRSALESWQADALRWTRSAVAETKSRLGVMESETDALLRRLSPASELISELEELRAQLRGDQRRADEVPLETLTTAHRRSDRDFQVLSEKLSAFAEAIHQGVLDGAAATGDLSTIEVGADGVPVVAAGPSVAVDLDDDDDDIEAVDAPRALDDLSSTAARAGARARQRLRGALVAGLVGVGILAGAGVLAAADRAPAPSPSPQLAPTAIAVATPAPSTEQVGPDVEDAIDAMLGRAHSEGPAPVAWSPDGAHVASGSANGVVRSWDARSGAALARIPVIEGGAVFALAWTPAGDTLALVSEDGALRLWDTHSRSITGVARAHRGPARALAITPSGRAIVTGGDDGKVRVWASASAQLVAELELAPQHKPTGRRRSAHAAEATLGSVVSLAAAEDEIVATAADGAVFHWSGHQPGTAVAHGSNPVSAVALPPDARWIAMGADSGALLISDLAGKSTRTLSGPAPITAVAAGPGGHRAAAAYADRTVRLWEVDSGAASASLAGAPAAVSALAFSPDGRRVLAGATDGTVLVWDAITGALVLTLPARARATRDIAFDGAQAVVLGPAVWRVDVATGARLARLDAGTGGARWVAVSEAGRRALVIGETDEARILDLSTGSTRRRIALPARPRAVAIAPDGAWAAVATTDDRVRVWASDTGVERLDFDAPGVRALAAAPDGNSLAAVGDDGVLRMWSVSGAERAFLLPLDLGPLAATAWSVGGDAVAAGSEDGRVVRVDVARREPNPLRRGRGSPVRALAFSPSGRHLAVGGLDTVVDLLPLADGDGGVTLGGHALGVTALAFSADGAYLGATVADGTARLHDLVHADARTVAERDGQWIAVDVRGRAACEPAPCPAAR